MSNSHFLNRSFKIAIGLTLFYLSLGFAFLHFGLADYGRDLRKPFVTLMRTQ